MSGTDSIRRSWLEPPRHPSTTKSSQERPLEVSMIRMKMKVKKAKRFIVVACVASLGQKK